MAIPGRYFKDDGVMAELVMNHDNEDHYHDHERKFKGMHLFIVKTSVDKVRDNTSLSYLIFLSFVELNWAYKAHVSNSSLKK